MWISGFLLLPVSVSISPPFNGIDTDNDNGSKRPERQRSVLWILQALQVCLHSISAAYQLCELRQVA